MSNKAEFTAPRRSARVFRKMKIQAQGRGHNGKKFREVCETLVVSAHGGLLMLKHEVDNDAVLVITNPETQEEMECRIVYLGDLCDQGQRVGIEFGEPIAETQEEKNSYQETVEQRLADVGFDEPIIMNDAQNRAEVNAAMKSLPAFAAEAANPARG